MPPQRRNARGRDAVFDVVHRPTIGRLNGLRLAPDYLCSPDLWSIQGDIPWDDAPLSTALRQRIDDWHEIWEQHCYFAQDRWADRDVCEAWETEGWLLWAMVNRELIPQGWIVKPDFAGYPRRRWPQKPSTRHRRIHRFYRQPVSARQALQIIDQSNAILRAHDDLLIAPLVPRVPVVKPHRRKHWR